MASFHFLAGILLIVVSIAVSQAALPTASFVLQVHPLVNVTWRFLDYQDENTSSSAIQMNVTYQGIAWVGVGFHRAGAHDDVMTYLDEWIGVFSGENVTVTDYYSGKNGPHDIDTDENHACKNNVLDATGYQQGNVSFYSFTRLLNTSDACDNVIVDDTIQLAYAFGSSNTFHKHQQAGLVWVNLFNPAATKIPTGLSSGVKFAIIIGGIFAILIVLNLIAWLVVSFRRNSTSGYTQINQSE